LSAKEAADR